MNGTVEIDRAGRIVVPKKMREALHLRAGDRLEIECSGEKLLLERERRPRGLYMKDGWLVWDGGGPTVTKEEVRGWIEEDREERVKHILGAGFKA